MLVYTRLPNKSYLSSTPSYRFTSKILLMHSLYVGFTLYVFLCLIVRGPSSFTFSWCTFIPYGLCTLSTHKLFIQFLHMVKFTCNVYTFTLSAMDKLFLHMLFVYSVSLVVCKPSPYQQYVLYILI